MSGSPAWLPKNQVPNAKDAPFAGALAKREQRRRIKRREAAITAASRLLTAGVQEMGRIMLTAKNPSDRIRAFIAIADRGQLPAMRELPSIEDVVGTVKTVTINYFEPPPGFSEVPPAEVVEAMQKFEAEQAAKALLLRTDSTDPG